MDGPECRIEIGVDPSQITQLLDRSEGRALRSWKRTPSTGVTPSPSSHRTALGSSKTTRWQRMGFQGTAFLLEWLFQYSTYEADACLS